MTNKAQLLKKFPEITNIYKHPMMDSTRWDRFVPRKDDIVIATSYKSGTTWVQSIVINLILPNEEDINIKDISPWLDMRILPLEETLSKLEKQKHRRVIKTHLPLNGLRFFKNVKYIIVGRDIRDVHISLWNFYRKFSESFLKLINADIDILFPPCPERFDEYWYNCMTKGWFDWETQGYPAWSSINFMQEWWNFNYLPNVIFVHYNNLLSNPAHQIEKIAQFLEIDVNQLEIDNIVKKTSFDYMKKNASRYALDSQFLSGRATSFFHKGRSEQWKKILSSEQLDLYDMAAKQGLSEDCRFWLETGRTV